ncbi:DUF4376 domain-containing protein [Microbulbifer sp. 2201CG32-9]|uniref:DUF4376 domain-containing protein n=1 Tax=Microbulbifer sp. 2201CG32-9 TaxID=3232309 RepID=UPI00345BC2D3
MPRLPEYDPLDVPATRQQVNDWRRDQEEAPLLVDGFFLDVDRESLHRMELRLNHWDQMGTASVAWMTAENHQLWLAQNDLRKLYDNALVEKSRRSAALHKAAQQFKRDGATLRQLREWKA